MPYNEHQKASNEIFKIAKDERTTNFDIFQILTRHFPAWKMRWWSFLLIGICMGAIGFMALSGKRWQLIVEVLFP